MPLENKIIYPKLKLVYLLTVGDIARWDDFTLQKHWVSHEFRTRSEVKYLINNCFMSDRKTVFLIIHYL